MAAAKKAPAEKKARSNTKMSADHKAAIASGREEATAVRRYLEALESNQPKRGRPRTPESIQQRIEGIDERLTTAAPLQRLGLIQTRIDLEGELAKLASDAGPDMAELEVVFVKYAAAYSSRKGIGYAAWRRVGVDARVLKDAGIPRTRG